MKINKLFQSNCDGILTYNHNYKKYFNSNYISSFYIVNDISINEEVYKNEIIKIYNNERKNKIFYAFMED